MSTFSQQVSDQLSMIKKQEAALGAAANSADSVKATLAIARTNLLIAKALDRIASNIRNR